MKQKYTLFPSLSLSHTPYTILYVYRCENCKVMAPTLAKLEQEYGDRVNFVMVNGDKSTSWGLIEAFGVDAIPHLALVSADGNVETALIGPIPKHILENDLDVLLANAAAAQLTTTSGAKRELPFQMLDVFANHPEQRRVHFEESTSK
jgi:thioredoxin-like negative regulator of GroEL